MKDALPVRGLRWFGESVFELQLAREGLPFVPGDCLALYTEDGRVSRPYSIASGPAEDLLRFVIRRMPGGVVSGYLAERRPGDQVRVSPPFGWFRPGEHVGQRPCIFLATGTGIAPYLSYLRSQASGPRIPCFYGVRKLADAVDLSWLQAQCELHLAVSREAAPGHYHGRITALFAEARMPEDADYYLCGLDAMIDDVTNILEDRGVPLPRIHRECFFNASYAT